MILTRFISIAIVVSSTLLPVWGIDVRIKGLGTVRGSSQNLFGGLVDSFWAIPYAEPPVGELRFTPAKPAKPWTGVRNATFTRIVCPQYISSSKKFIGKEDCLYLNVFRPRDATKRNHPVLFWVHGGSFIQGSGFSYNGDIIAAKYNVIVVTVNYRLGILGFFNVPGSKTSGNFGLLDQIQALKWVKQHVHEFGGDPAQVTIAGLSAGAASVSILMLSPLTKGLFKRVIAQSGSPTSTWAVRKVVNETFATAFGAQLGCKDAPKVASCLKKVPWIDVMKGQIRLADTLDHVVPHVDKYVLSEYPYKEYMENRLPSPDVDLLIGFTKDEGTMFVPDEVPLTNSVMKIVIRRGLRWNYGKSAGVVAEMVSFQYQKYKLPSDMDYQKPLKIFTDDFYFKRDIMNFAAAWAKKRNQTYVYEFSYLPSHPKYPHWAVAHGIEKAFVFGAPLRRIGDPWRKNSLVGNFTEKEKMFSMNLMRMWTDFVKTGNPHNSWPQFDGVRGRYLQIDVNNTVRENFNPRMMAFWNKHIPTVMELASNSGCNSRDKSVSSATALTFNYCSSLVTLLLILFVWSLNRG